MGIMYVANASRQIQDFQYRVPGVAQPRRQTIPIGGQVQLSGELKPKEIEHIIRQHQIYGLISCGEITVSDTLAPLCYSLDRPVPEELIEILSRRNLGVLTTRGEDQRKNAAIVMTSQIGQNLREQGTGMELGEVAIDVLEHDDQASQARRAGTGDARHEEHTIVQRADRTGPSRSRRA